MDMGFNVNKVFQDRLAASMGLDKYRDIMERVNNTNVATDMDFQRAFNGFYIVRRDADWRKVYYGHFEILKNAVTLYSGMEQWYADFLKSENGKECIREFDRVLPDYKGISNVKKIDSILWSMR